MADARQRRFDILLVWKIDRFGRSLKHLVNSLAELESVGVAFVSLRDSLDLRSPAGRLMAQLLGAISEFERSLITERVRAGIRNGQRQDRSFEGCWNAVKGYLEAAWDFSWQCSPCSSGGAFQQSLALAHPPPPPNH
jgi:DNA invertase Pin-like site-specific DNA recombinase